MKEKILFITKFFPYPLDEGGKKRTYSTLRLLTTLYDVDFISFVENRRDFGYVKEVEKLGVHAECVYKKIKHHKTPFLLILEISKSIFCKYPYVIFKYFSFMMRNKITKKIAQNRYKIIYVEGLPLFQYVLPLSLNRKRILVILDQHNVESEVIGRRLSKSKNIFSRLFLKLEYFKLIRCEKKACSLADLVLTITERDRVKLIKLTGGKCNCYVSPFFVDRRDDLTYCYNGQKDKTILFLGTMSWYPNVDGILWFYKKVFVKHNMRDLGWKLLVVGNNPIPSVVEIDDNKFVKVTGYVNDIRPYLKDSLLGIIPMRTGGGMRIKVLDLFSFGMPVISTSIGCEGIPVVNGENILIANTPEEFINALNSIYSDEILRKKLSQNAIRLIEKEYSYSAASKTFLKLLKKY